MLGVPPIAAGQAATREGRVILRVWEQLTALVVRVDTLETGCATLMDEADRVTQVAERVETARDLVRRLPAVQDRTDPVDAP